MCLIRMRTIAVINTVGNYSIKLIMLIFIRNEIFAVYPDRSHNITRRSAVSLTRRI